MSKSLDVDDSRPNVLPLIEKYGGKHGERLIAIAATVQLAMPAYKWAKDKRKKEDYTIVVAGTDDVYPLLHDWVLERIPTNDRKALIAVSSTNNGRDSISSSDALPTQKGPLVRLRYDGSRKQALTLNGHKIDVEVSREEISSSQNIPENWRRYLEKITFTATAPEGRDAVMRMLEGLAQTLNSAERRPSLLIPARWGGEWSRRNDVPLRTLNSVVLKHGQLERLIDDLSLFIASENEYARLSQPWHRGHLYYGTAGTGKTSVARALANHFDLSVYYLPLGDLEHDADLMGLVGQIRPRSMLLIEDIDNFHAATDRDDEQGKASLAAMLNALDGVWTPHGLVTVLTTNHIGMLDDALIRAGRVDIREEFDVLDFDQATRLADFCGVSWNDVTVGAFVGCSPAEFMEAARQQRIGARQ